jgi:chemotaxis methyl-accepting protein methylase
MKKKTTTTVSRQSQTKADERDHLINAIIATEQNIFRTQEQLRDLKDKLARQHAEFFKRSAVSPSVSSASSAVKKSPTKKGN